MPCTGFPTILHTVPRSTLHWSYWAHYTRASLNMTQVCRPGAGDSAQLHAVGCHTALVARLEVNTVPSIPSSVLTTPMLPGAQSPHRGGAPAHHAAPRRRGHGRLLPGQVGVAVCLQISGLRLLFCRSKYPYYQMTD